MSANQQYVLLQHGIDLLRAILHCKEADIIYVIILLLLSPPTVQAYTV